MTGQAKTFLTGVATAEGWSPATLLEVLFQYLDAERARSSDSYVRLADFIEGRRESERDGFVCSACAVSESEGAASAECDRCELCENCCPHGVVSCVGCGEAVDEQEAVSTYCGTLHATCLDAHARECAQCDEDGLYHGEIVKID
jgi:hypothetical protein